MKHVVDAAERGRRGPQGWWQKGANRTAQQALAETVVAEPHAWEKGGSDTGPKDEADGSA